MTVLATITALATRDRTSENEGQDRNEIGENIPVVHVSHRSVRHTFRNTSRYCWCGFRKKRRFRLQPHTSESQKIGLWISSRDNISVSDAVQPIGFFPTLIISTLTSGYIAGVANLWHARAKGGKLVDFQ